MEMANVPLLYWRKNGREALHLITNPFKSEQEFEQTVFDTPAVLGDIYRLKRQVRGGDKPGIPDIIGIDSEGKVCVVEMKNTEVDAGIIPQLLEYAIWAERNPDSIRSLWLEAKDRPEDLEVDWDEYSVRVLVISSSIDRSTLEHVNKIAYPVDLIEISRWSHGKDSWLLVNKLEPLTNKKVKPVSGLKTYDQATYEEFYNPKSVVGFLKTCRAVQQVAHKNGWPVEIKFNKHYCGFKVGNYVVFGVKWLGSRSYALYFKVPETFAKRANVPGYKMLRYESLWKNAIFPVTGDELHLARFKHLFQKALEQRMD
jgi:hypothetical protein